MSMKRSLAAAALLLGLVVQPAWAGTWVHVFTPGSFQIGGSFGTATRSTDAIGNPMLSFASAGNQYATAPFTVPSFVTATEMDCTWTGRTASTTATDCGGGAGSCRINIDMSSKETNPNGTLKWESNIGDGILAPNAGDNLPGAVSNGTIWGTVTAVPFTNQGDGLQCDPQTCVTFPSRFRFIRNSTTNTANNDTAAFELIQVTCTATTE